MILLLMDWINLSELVWSGRDPGMEAAWVPEDRFVHVEMSKKLNKQMASTPILLSLRLIVLLEWVPGFLWL